MPKGSDYPGPADRLDVYRALVDRHPDADVLGAKNPYTSRNGWMTSFLDPDGAICVRLGAEERGEALEHGASSVQQYGRNMPDFAGLPIDLTDGDADAWFALSWDHAGALKPK
ncbi:MAG: hypothetical protein AAF548_11765 [Actinomycetota bacterium]